jgi:hypothetical protein
MTALRDLSPFTVMHTIQHRGADNKPQAAQL